MKKTKFNYYFYFFVIVAIGLVITGVGALLSRLSTPPKSTINDDTAGEQRVIKPEDSAFTYSNDKSKVVFVRDTGDHRPSDYFAEGTDIYNQLVLRDIKDNTERVIVRSGPISEMNIENLPKNFPIDILIDMAGPKFSPDDRTIYFSAPVRITSPGVFSYTIETSKLQFVTDGGLLGVITAKPYSGMLLVQQHRYNPAPEYGSYDHIYIIDTKGKEIKDLGNWDEQDTIFEKY